MQEMANAWHEEPVRAVGTKRALYASLLIGLAFAVSTVVYALAWLDAGVSQLCFELGDVTDPQCPDPGGPSFQLTAARWVTWLVAAGLSIAAVFFAVARRRGRA